jgi:rhodanese-related sulfurtransferase
MKKLLFLPLLILFAANVFADAAPAKVPGAATIDAQMAKMLLDKGIVFVDARDDAHFKEGHIPGAKHLSVKDEGFTEANLSKIVAKDKPVVFYCTGNTCLASSEAAQKAVAWGWTTVYYFRGGLTQWKTSGLPVE